MGLGGYPILNKHREIAYGNRSGPCIIISPAQQKQTNNKTAELIEAIQSGNKENYMAENDLTKTDVQCIHASMLNLNGRIGNQKTLKSGWKIKEYLKYVDELYFSGIELQVAIKKALRVVYGRV